jgi:uncharacterized protein (TIGR03435 family)
MISYRSALTRRKSGNRTTRGLDPRRGCAAPPDLNWQGRRLLVIALVAASSFVHPPHLQAQALPVERPPAFDVASVKLNRSADDSSSSAFASGGAFNARNATVRGVIQEAYQLKDGNLLGVPGWADSERYDIAAKPESPVSTEQAHSMLQTLLADRFLLKVHRETREVPVYALTVGNRGAKLKEAVDSNCVAPPSGPPSGPPPRTGYCGGSLVSRGRLTSRKVSMQKFAATLSEIMGRPALDMTELAGVFDIDLQWSPDETQFGGTASTDSSGAPSIYAALQDLGLKLEARKGPIEVVVIDHVERPSEN